MPRAAPVTTPPCRPAGYRQSVGAAGRRADQRDDLPVDVGRAAGEEEPHRRSAAASAPSATCTRLAVAPARSPCRSSGPALQGPRGRPAQALGVGPAGRRANTTTRRSRASRFRAGARSRARVEIGRLRAPLSVEDAPRAGLAVRRRPSGMTVDWRSPRRHEELRAEREPSLADEPTTGPGSRARPARSGAARAGRGRPSRDVTLCRSRDVDEVAVPVSHPARVLMPLSRIATTPWPPAAQIEISPRPEPFSCEQLRQRGDDPRRRSRRTGARRPARSR